MDIHAVNAKIRGAADVGEIIVADHHGFLFFEPVAVKQDLKIVAVGLGTLLVGADTNAVKIRRQSEHIQLIFGKGALRIGEQIDAAAVCLYRIEQLRHAVIELDIFGGEAAKHLAHLQHRRLFRLDALARKQGAEHLFNFYIDHRRGRMTLTHSLFLLLHKLAVSLAKLLKRISRAVVAVEDRHFFPKLGAPFVGIDVHQGAVKVKNIVFISHIAPPFFLYSTNFRQELQYLKKYGKLFLRWFL